MISYLAIKVGYMARLSLFNQFIVQNVKSGVVEIIFNLAYPSTFDFFRITLHGEIRNVDMYC